MDWLSTSVSDASLLDFAIVLVAALLLFFALRRWVASVLIRLGWVLGGGPAIGALVDVDGYVGEVESLGLSRVTLRSSDGARVTMPLAGIDTVAVHTKGHQACIVDIILPPGNDQAKFIEGMVVTRTETIRERFPNTLREPPRLLGRHETNAGQILLRVYFPIWPGCGEPIEAVFKPQISDALSKIDPDYADWMITVTYDAVDDS